MKFPLRKMWPQLPLSAGDYPSAGLTHSYLIQAADHGIALESLNAEVSATLDPRAGSEGNENAPVYPQSITYTVRLVSSASAEQIARVSEAEALPDPRPPEAWQ